MPEKANHLSVLLIKGDVTDFDDVVIHGLKRVDIAENQVFYGKDSVVRPPEWVRGFFGEALDNEFTMRTASARGVFVTSASRGAERRIFAVTFGYGRFFLEDSAIEDRFGLKVVLNSVKQDHLRSIEKTALGSIPKQSREQMSRASEVANFGIDIEQDLLNAVTGIAKDEILGKVISGKDVLALNAKFDLSNIADLLPLLIERYNDDSYKSEGFDWVDQIRDVKNPKQIEELDTWLIENLSDKNSDKIWMIPPTILNWVHIGGFRYGGTKRPDVHSDMDTLEFLEELGNPPYSIDGIKNKKVHAISAATDEVADSWSAYKCFYAEANINEKTFILNNGRWYEISSDFSKIIVEDFDGIVESDLQLPPYNVADEGEYNKVATASVEGAICLDANMIKYGGGHSSIEFCDIFHPSKKLIHVKRYSGSAQLSHLFNQGVVSGELFVSASDFRAKLNEKLPPEVQLDVQAQPDAKQYEVIYAVIMPKGKEFDIPFFSKVTMRNARQRLRAYGYTVKKLKIESET